MVYVIACTENTVTIQVSKNPHYQIAGHLDGSLPQQKIITSVLLAAII